MPYVSSNIPISNTKHDLRVKLLPEQRESVKIEYAAGVRQSVLARKYGVSVSLIKHIVSPARQAYCKKRNKEHWKEYSNREQLTIAVRALRRKKHALYKQGEIKLTDKKVETD